MASHRGQVPGAAFLVGAGGKDADPGEFPFVALIGHKKTSKRVPLKSLSS